MIKESKEIKNKSYFITATDTDAGKTVVTALALNYLLSCKKSVISQKWVQTGNVEFSQDLEFHKKFADLNFTKSLNKHVSPYIFEFAGSPHFAAKLENSVIKKSKIIESFKFLQKKFEHVIVEGSGGVLTPYDEKKFLIDIARELDLPVILVVANKLGSINHTLLSLEYLTQKKMNVKGIIFNNSKNCDVKILENNIKTVKNFAKNITILGQIPYSKNKKVLIKSFEEIGEKLI